MPIAETFLDAWLLAACGKTSSEHLSDKDFGRHAVRSGRDAPHSVIEDASGLLQVNDALCMQHVDKRGGDCAASQGKGVGHDESPVVRLSESDGTTEDPTIQSSA
jgi:hypothetical protein